MILTGTDPDNNPREINVDANGNLQTNLATALSYQNDSVTVGRQSKGPVYNMFTNAAANGRSAVTIDGTGFNALLVAVKVASAATGCQVALVGANTLDSNNAEWFNCYEGSTLLSTGVIKDYRIVLWKGLPDVASLSIGSYTDGQVTVYAQPINL